MSSMEETTNPPAIKRHMLSTVFWWGGGLVLIVALLVAFMMYRMNDVPADLDTSTTKLSSQGLYRASYESRLAPMRINQLHSWTIHVETAAGQPVEDAQITVHGDMPQHGHGLATQPQVTQYLGSGNYLVEGMKFQMAGWWYVQFEVSAGGKQDSVRFDFVLK